MEGIFYFFQASNMQFQGIVNEFLYMLMGGEETINQLIMVHILYPWFTEVLYT